MTDVVHRDILGKEINVGDVVICPGYTTSKLCTVARVTSVSKKMIRVRPLLDKDKKNIGRWYIEEQPEHLQNTFLRYPHGVAVVNSEDVTFFILRNS